MLSSWSQGDKRTGWGGDLGPAPGSVTPKQATDGDGLLQRGPRRGHLQFYSESAAVRAVLFLPRDLPSVFTARTRMPQQHPSSSHCSDCCQRGICDLRPSGHQIRCWTRVFLVQSRPESRTGGQASAAAGPGGSGAGCHGFTVSPHVASAGTACPHVLTLRVLGAGDYCDAYLTHDSVSGWGLDVLHAPLAPWPVLPSLLHNQGVQHPSPFAAAARGEEAAQLGIQAQGGSQPPAVCCRRST